MRTDGDSGASVQMEQSWNADGRVACGSIATEALTAATVQVQFRAGKK